MIDWLLFIAKGEICQLYHGGNKLNIDEIMMMKSVLYYTNMLIYDFLKYYLTETTFRG